MYVCVCVCVWGGVVMTDNHNVNNTATYTECYRDDWRHAVEDSRDTVMGKLQLRNNYYYSHGIDCGVKPRPV